MLLDEIMRRPRQAATVPLPSSLHRLPSPILSARARADECDGPGLTQPKLAAAAAGHVGGLRSRVIHLIDNSPAAVGAEAR